MKGFSMSQPALEDITKVEFPELDVGSYSAGDPSRLIEGREARIPTLEFFIRLFLTTNNPNLLSFSQAQKDKKNRIVIQEIDQRWGNYPELKSYLQSYKIDATPGLMSLLIAVQKYTDNIISRSESTGKLGND